jgi:gliding motility-associated-like protein
MMNRFNISPLLFIIGTIFSVLLFISPKAKAQLTTSTTMTPTQLVQNVLLGGGLTASNITYSGDATAIGSFNGTASNIGFTGGVIMASGAISNAIGPNNIGSATTDFSTTSTDPQLSGIAAAALHDAAILEFDFTVTSDTLKFRYVFGSEEYMEFVNAGYNDAFGFFITGPNPAGGSYASKNIALIPGTTTPVSIDNVNLFVNGTYYFDNGDGSGSGTAPDGATVQYDGFTHPLTAVAAVVCGQTYHIKLAIADAGDGAWDSGVFLEAGSFASAGNANLTSGTNFGGVVAGNDSTIYEGCGFASLLVTRTTSTSSQTYNYSLGGTATNGVDYTALGNSVAFAPGQDSAYIIINSLPDNLTEGTETAILSVFAPSSCGGTDTLRKTVYIIDTPPLVVTLNPDTSLVCPSQNLFLTAHASGGVAIGGKKYTWSNSTATTDTIHIHPLVTTKYIVTVSDSCGHTVSDSTTVTFVPYIPLQLQFNNDTALCGGDDLLLNAHVTNGLANYSYLWNPNISVSDTVTIWPAASSTYIVKITDGCGNSKSDTVNVSVYPIHADFQSTFTTNQTVAFGNLSTGAVSYLWNFGDGSNDSTSTLENPEHYYANEGTYKVMLVATNQNGCSDTAYHTVIILPDFYFYSPNAFTPNKNGDNDVFTGYGSGIKTYRMRIFDRWGNLLFESNDINVGWDGTYKGANAEYAVYVCVFDLESMRGQKIRRIDSVTLVR